MFFYYFPNLGMKTYNDFTLRRNILSFAECSKLAVVWFLIPNTHQFLRIAYPSWTPSSVYAFDTLYWAIAIEVRA